MLAVLGALELEGELPGVHDVLAARLDRLVLRRVAGRCGPEACDCNECLETEENSHSKLAITVDTVILDGRLGGLQLVLGRLPCLLWIAGAGASRFQARSLLADKSLLKTCLCDGLNSGRNSKNQCS